MADGPLGFGFAGQGYNSGAAVAQRKKKQYDPSVEQWRPLVSKYFPTEQVDKMLYVIQGESGGNAQALGDGGNSFGLFQSQSKRGTLSSPEGQVADAYARWLKSGYSDWGEGTLYHGQKFGALGRNPYPGDEGTGFNPQGTGDGPLGKKGNFAPTSADQVEQFLHPKNQQKVAAAMVQQKQQSQQAQTTVKNIQEFNSKRKQAEANVADMVKNQGLTKDQADQELQFQYKKLGVAGAPPKESTGTKVKNVLFHNPVEHAIGGFAKDTAVSTVQAAAQTGAGVVNLERLGLSKIPGYGKYEPVQKEKGGLPSKLDTFIGNPNLKQYAGAFIQTGALAIPGGGKLLEELGAKVAPDLAERVIATKAERSLAGAGARAGISALDSGTTGAVFGAGGAMRENKSGKDIAKEAGLNALVFGGAGAGGSLLKSGYRGFNPKPQNLARDLPKAAKEQGVDLKKGKQPDMNAYYAKHPEFAQETAPKAEGKVPKAGTPPPPPPAEKPLGEPTPVAEPTPAAPPEVQPPVEQPAPVEQPPVEQPPKGTPKKLTPKVETPAPKAPKVEPPKAAGDLSAIEDQAQQRFGKPANKLSPNQVQTILSEDKVPLAGGRDISQKVGSHAKGLEASDARPVLYYGPQDKAIITDGYSLVQDKNVAKALYEDRFNKDAIKQAKSGDPSIPYEQRLKEARAEIDKTAKDAGDYPDMAKLDESTGGMITKPTGKVAEVKGYYSGGDNFSSRTNAVVSDGKTTVVVDSHKLAFMDKHLPDTEIHIRNENDPVQFVKDGKVKGVLMPLKSGDTKIPDFGQAKVKNEPAPKTPVIPTKRDTAEATRLDKQRAANIEELKAEAKKHKTAAEFSKSVDSYFNEKPPAIRPEHAAEDMAKLQGWLDSHSAHPYRNARSVGKSAEEIHAEAHGQPAPKVEPKKPAAKEPTTHAERQAAFTAQSNDKIFKDYIDGHQYPSRNGFEGYVATNVYDKKRAAELIKDYNSKYPVEGAGGKTGVPKSAPEKPAASNDGIVFTTHKDMEGKYIGGGKVEKTGNPNQYIVHTTAKNEATIRARLADLEINTTGKPAEPKKVEAPAPPPEPKIKKVEAPPEPTPPPAAKAPSFDEQLINQTAAEYGHHDQLVEDIASQLFNEEKSRKGGQLVPDGEQYGSGYKRITEHSRFYSDWYAEHKKPPTLQDYREAVRSELEGGSKGAAGAVQEPAYKSIYQLIKNRVEDMKATSELGNEQGGYVAPGQAVADVKAFLDETHKENTAAGNLSDQLYALRKNSEADQQALVDFLKGTKDISTADKEAVYHHAEDKNVKLTADQQTIYDKYVAPLIQARNDEMAKLKAAGVDMGERDHIHRIAMGKGSGLERFLEGQVSAPREGGVLRKTTSSMQRRTMKVLEDRDGNRQVVSIKTPKDATGKASRGGMRVTAWDAGKATDMGALKKPTLPQVMEFYDPELMHGLNKVADDLGITHERTNKTVGGRKSKAGVSLTGQNKIVTKAATPEDVILHELGHQIDDRYNLREVFNTRGLNPDRSKDVATRTKELRALADLRFGSDTSQTAPSYVRYVRKGEEKIANMFAAYLHAPDTFKRVAPNTYKDFVNFVKSHDELKPILDLKPSMKLDSQTIGEKLPADTFKDNTGKVWKIKDATTKEIEGNTSVRYYKDPIVNSALDYHAVRNAARANQFLEEWKTAPEFSDIAVKEGEGKVPSGWRGTSAPQFRGYYFAPKVAETLDDFAGSTSRDPLQALDGMNRFLRTTIFFNPLIHIPNVAASWGTNRGVTGLLPPGLWRLVKTMPAAIDDVVHQSDLYKELLRKGAPFMHFNQEEFSGQIMKLMDDQIQNKAVSKKLSDALGYANPAKMLKAWYGISHKATWYSNDIFTMQAIREQMAKGATQEEAIANVGKFIPNYRLPTRFAGSRRAKVLLSNHNVTMFMPYHYGILKSYANAVHDLVGHVPIKDRAAAADKLLMGAVVGLVGFPLADKAVQSLTGNENSKVRRVGPYTIPFAIADVIQHKPGATTAKAVQKAVTPAVGSLGLYQLLTNKNYFGGEIYSKDDLTKNPKQALRDIGDFAAGLVAPVASGQKLASGRQSLGKFIGGLVGISNPKSPAETRMNELLDKQFNSSGQTKEQQRASAAKAAARAQIAQGKGDSLAKDLVKAGVLSKDKLDDFESTAKWSSTQRAFDLLNTSGKLEILKMSKPADYGNFVNDKNSLMLALSGTANDKNAKLTTRQAARQLIQLLGGNIDDLYPQYQEQRRQKSRETRLRNLSNGGL